MAQSDKFSVDQLRVLEADGQWQDSDSAFWVKNPNLGCYSKLTVDNMKKT